MKNIQEDKEEIENSILNIQTLKDYHERSIYSCSFNQDGTLLATVNIYIKYNLFKRQEETIE